MSSRHGQSARRGERFVRDGSMTNCTAQQGHVTVHMMLKWHYTAGER